MLNPGFRIIALSQRLGKYDIIENELPIEIIGNGEIFHYKNGKDITVVSSNFSFPQANKLIETLTQNGFQPSYFHISSGLIEDFHPIIRDVAVTKRIIVIDDSKSLQTPVDNVLALLCGMDLQKKIVLKRQLNEDWLQPVSDLFEINEQEVINQLKNL